VKLSNPRTSFFVCPRFATLAALCCLGGPTIRTIPRAQAPHPGNIFLRGEQIVISTPAGAGTNWVVMDYDGRRVSEGRDDSGKANVGSLPAGYYELRREGGSNRVSIGVLEPLTAPTPTNSPIAIDVAMAWFFQKEKMADVASLCQLAGINRVRDRLMWQEMEPRRGDYSGHNKYDDSAEIQSGAGLQVLQVSHVSANWANPNVKRFPLDLRDAYNFNRDIARRWNGKVVAFEPWNEADIPMFGGHTGSEMATLQKAAYLGLKAGNSNVIACENVFAIRRAATLADFNDNEAWPYFDTYNLHHYEALQNYPSLYADHRAVSAGRPMWTTECSVRVKWSGDEKLKELSDEDLQLQSERVTKTYVLAIHQGTKAVFYFMLPHYSEGQVQFGVLHSDLTPRPAFLAVAAAGRLLAGAEPLGRVDLAGGLGQGYFFRTQTDGHASDVMVIWSKQDTTYDLSNAPRACYDHLGRVHTTEGKTLKVGRAPLYVVLADESRPKLLAPPKPPKWLEGKPGYVVLQALLPESDVVVEKSAYKMKAGESKTIPVFAYNFGDEKVRGSLKAQVPEHWEAELPEEVELAPGDRKELTVKIRGLEARSGDETRVRVVGEFGKAGGAVLAFHLIVE
jgi:hypothetical protein